MRVRSDVKRVARVIFDAFERPRVARGVFFVVRDTRFRPLAPRRVGVRVAMLA
jgi:hypothetical protein